MQRVADLQSTYKHRPNLLGFKLYESATDAVGRLDGLHYITIPEFAQVEKEIVDGFKKRVAPKCNAVFTLKDIPRSKITDEDLVPMVRELARIAKLLESC
jgi:hypothetical protein